MIGPTEGKFKYTLMALQNGKRIRSVLHPNKKNIKLALMTSHEHASILKSRCGNNGNSNSIDNDPKIQQACRLWSNGTLFDDVVLTPNEVPYKANDEHANLARGTSKYWLKALSGYIRAPYTHSLFLDSDAYPCPGVEKLFALTNPTAVAFENYWQMAETAPGDLAVGLAQYAKVNNKKWIPGDKNILKDCERFAERNTGTVLFSFVRPQLSHTLAHFIPLVAEHVYNNVATPEKKVNHDQIPFRVALYLFHRFEPDFVEHQIPMHASCRTFVGCTVGTDGFLNGMYPVQQQHQGDGKHCSECHCTPCLINHNAGGWDVKINGTMGWEEEEEEVE